MSPTIENKSCCSTWFKNRTQWGKSTTSSPGDIIEYNMNFKCKTPAHLMTICRIQTKIFLPLSTMTETAQLVLLSASQTTLSLHQQAFIKAPSSCLTLCIVALLQ